MDSAIDIGMRSSVLLIKLIRLDQAKRIGLPVKTLWPSLAIHSEFSRHSYTYLEIKQMIFRDDIGQKAQYDQLFNTTVHHYRWQPPSACGDPVPATTRHCRTLWKLIHGIFNSGSHFAGSQREGCVWAEAVRGVEARGTCKEKVARRGRTL